MIIGSRVGRDRLDRITIGEPTDNVSTVPFEVSDLTPQTKSKSTFSSSANALVDEAANLHLLWVANIT
jgi:hypothetical protein